MSDTATEEVKPLRGKLLKNEEVAELLRISPKTVHVMGKRGDIPPHRIGSLVMFDSADVDDYLFFSKLHRLDGYLSLSAIDKQKIIDRVEDQIAHSMSYLKKLLNETKKEGKPMEQ